MRKIPAVPVRMMVFIRVWVVSWSSSRSARKDGRPSPGTVLAGASKSIQGKRARSSVRMLRERSG